MKSLKDICEGLLGEGLLDTDFDINDDDMTIDNVQPITHKNWQIIPAMSDKIYRNATDAFFDQKPEDPEHLVQSGYGKRHMCRYFIDWLAFQSIGDINDDQFTASKPRLVENFNKWINNPKFTLTMVKMGGAKDIYFNYNKVKMLRIRFS